MTRGDRLRVVSHFPGRLRVRAETFRILPEVAAEVAQALGAEVGVLSVATSGVTGSLVILYDPRETQLLRLIRSILSHGGLEGVEVATDAPERGTPGTRLRKALGAADSFVRERAGGRGDLRSGVPGTLALLGVGRLLTGGARLPEWYDLLFWSFVTFSNLNPREEAPEKRSDDG